MRIKKEYLVISKYFVIILAVFFVLYSNGGGITGFFFVGGQEYTSIPVNQQFSESSEFNTLLDSPSIINGILLSGQYKGEGTINVYLKNQDEKILVFSEEVKEEEIVSGNLITGNVVGDINTGESEEKEEPPEEKEEPEETKEEEPKEDDEPEKEEKTEDNQDEQTQESVEQEEDEEATVEEKPEESEETTETAEEGNNEEVVKEATEEVVEEVVAEETDTTEEETEEEIPEEATEEIMGEEETEEVVEEEIPEEVTEEETNNQGSSEIIIPNTNTTNITIEPQVNITINETNSTIEINESVNETEEEIVEEEDKEPSSTGGQIIQESDWEEFEFECEDTCDISLNLSELDFEIELIGNVSFFISQISVSKEESVIEEPDLDLIQSFENLELQNNQTLSIDLTNYFLGESLNYQVDFEKGVNIVINSNTAEIMPSTSFSGQVKAQFYAINDDGRINGNEFIIDVIDPQKEEILQNLFEMFPHMKVMEAFKEGDYYSIVFELDESVIKINGIQNVTDINNITMGTFNQEITI